jgi:cell division septation protein DedD
MDPASVRNLERIQEKDDVSRMPRAVSITLLVLGGACIVLSAMALGGKKSGEAAPKNDPLGDLVTQKKPGTVGAAAKTADLAASDVTFPSMLSDNAKPTTALAAVNAKPDGTNAVPTQPPPPTDVIPVMPLPAQNVLEASPVLTHPRDGLTRAASEAQASAETQPAPAGHDGNYQLQVSSFKTREEADKFAQDLRVRGHKSYVIQANVPSRGTWYRVRVGPFPTQAAATAYRSSFEAKEHVVPFVVPPSSQQH